MGPKPSEPQLSDCDMDRMLAEAEVRLATTSTGGPNPCQTSSSRALVRPSKPSTNSCRQPKLQNDHQDLTLRQPKLAPSQAAKAKTKDKDNMGPDWYNLPRTSSDPDTKRHLQLLHTRHVWNSKKHWRKSTVSLPTFSQMGTLVEGRSHNAGKFREGPSLVKELLQAEHSSKQLKKRYDVLQAGKQSGKGGFRGRGIRKWK